jgi:2'-5' RNA ligase
LKAIDGAIRLAPMTARLFTLAYPTLSATGKAVIGGIRAVHDPHNALMVEPHFTLVFGTTGVGQEDYLNHVEQIAASSPAVRFHCRYAALGTGEKADTSHVYLVPDEGNSDIYLLHDRLYSGPLTSHLRLDLQYVPHITIGTCPDAARAKALCDEINEEGLSIAGAIRTLTVALLANGMVQNLQSFELGSCVT